MAEEEGIHKHAFWLYGVLVGIAIKHALDTTIPHIFDPSHIQGQLTATQLAQPQSQYSFWPDLGRLLVFLILIIRFYLGSAFYFSDIHDASSGYDILDSSEEDAQPLVKNYALDFICGFTHFLAFVILAMNIDPHTKQLFWFPVLVGFILFYDFIWWIFSLRYYSADYIFWWMIVNSGTLVISGIIYLLAYYPGKRELLTAEACALIPVVAVSAYDIGAMMLDKPYFESVRNRLSRKPKRPRQAQRKGSSATTQVVTPKPPSPA